ncbi:MAG: aminotransferase class I/II-fold pyridoxal phosphate-dependent enzyme [Treponema phagedenis]|uniref:aminotransferase class I/II-fold pyridoxal phosphate-dependent enzyme n=1 Tax=Treponema phagedenis TaxID=162 RepID=UPI003133ED7F
MKIHPIAKELNEILEQTVAGKLLSNLGKRLFFPKGIIAQGAEAKLKAPNANATIGMMCKNKIPVELNALHDLLPAFSPSEIVAYTPTAGTETVRKLWYNNMLLKNPSLENKKISLPVLVPGLTAGLSFTLDLFLSSKDRLIVPQPAWDNYQLIAEARRNASTAAFPIFDGDNFNIKGFTSCVEREAKSGMLKILLNFPQNPSGYTPTEQEVDSMYSILFEQAEKGVAILIIFDDAYFGLEYESEAIKESLFVRFADAHKNILAVKIDGPTKEDYVWGLRTGFITFASKGFNDIHYETVIKKLLGAIRSSVSCSATPSQTFAVKILENEKTDSEIQNLHTLLNDRYKEVKRVLKKFSSSEKLKPLPFNSGYFMCMHCSGFNAETLRQKLLNEYQIGVVAVDDCHIRIAFSSLDIENIEPVYTAIFEAAENL